MNKYLITATEVYRVSTQSEVDSIIEKAKNDDSFQLVKYNCEYKERKAKGEVIDDWYKLTLIKSFNDEKDPERYVEVTYEV